MNNQEVFAAALQNALAADIAEYEKLPDHIFSRRFERKMKKLLYTPQPVFQLNGRHIPLRKSVVIAMLAVILAVLITGAAFAVYRLWEQYRIEDNGLFSMLYITDIENAPKTLEEEYRIGADMSGYAERVIQDDEYCYLVEYTLPDSKVTIIFSQATKEFSEQAMINTENALITPTEITINGCKGFYFMTYYGSHYVLWDNGDYIVDMSAYGISKDELISLAETVQKVENKYFSKNM